jgi:hypothetical protein
MSYLKYGFYFQIVKGMQIAKPLNLINYKKGEAMKVLQDSFEWKYYGGKHYESRFTKFFQGWYLPTKWGYDKRLAHLSSLVASGEITREEALKEFKVNSIQSEEIESDKDYMARKLGITRSEFDYLVDCDCREHHEYPCSNQWVRSMNITLYALYRRIASKIK